MKKLIEKLPFPKYSYIPMLALVALHMFSYFGTKLINGNMEHHLLDFAIDGNIPLLPDWVVIYVAAFFFWAAGLLLAMLNEKRTCYELFSAMFYAELICAAIFIFYPTMVNRPEIIGSDFSAKLLSVIYASDAPTNVFPSMHCMFSYMVFRGALHSRNIKTPYIIYCGVFALLVCLSTVFVKQHVAVDAFGGIIFGEIAVLLGIHFPLTKLFDRFLPTEERI